MRYQAVLFDFDYTLGDSTGPIVASTTAGLVGMGWPAPEREAVRRTIGYTLEDGYSRLTGDWDEARRQEYFQRFHAHALPIMARDTVLFPGVEELLRWLRAQGTAAGIVSTKGSDVIRDIFARAGLLELLSLVIGGRDVSKAKPDPEGLNRAVEQLGCPKSAVLFCGDTVIDAETAQRAGVDFCAVLNGITPAAEFAAFPHVHIAPDLADELAWLKQN